MIIGDPFGSENSETSDLIKFANQVETAAIANKNDDWWITI